MANRIGLIALFLVANSRGLIVLRVVLSSFEVESKAES